MPDKKRRRKDRTISNHHPKAPQIMEHNSAFSKDQANVGNAYAKNKGKLKGNLLHMPRD